MEKVEVIVLDYDPSWPEHFENIKARLLPGLSQFSVDIQHVGSTSVSGLSAKPVIDIDVIAEKPKETKGILTAIQQLGYEHLGDLGIKGREAFKKIEKEGEDNLARHNLYLGLRHSISIQNHLRLRDFLRREHEVAAEYGKLKKELAKKYPNNRALYTEKKSDFILNLLATLGFEEEHLQDIRKQNKA
jgi:GrpB-like predicted nucleotidyltransferase (UPF0157 family)